MRGLFLKGTLLGLILGVALMLIVFFFTPFVARYVPVNEEGAGMYIVGKWSGDVRFCLKRIEKFYLGGKCVKLAYLP